VRAAGVLAKGRMFDMPALHVSGGLSAHHQDLKNCTYSIWYISSLLAASNSSKQA